jgi:hypothetical protein
MVGRCELSDAQGQRIATFCLAKPAIGAGRGAGNRLFVNAVLRGAAIGRSGRICPSGTANGRPCTSASPAAKAGAWERVFDRSDLQIRPDCVGGSRCGNVGRCTSGPRPAHLRRAGNQHGRVPRLVRVGDYRIKDTRRKDRWPSHWIRKLQLSARKRMEEKCYRARFSPDGMRRLHRYEARPRMELADRTAERVV